MMKQLFLALLICLGGQRAAADVAGAVQRHVLPGYAAFAAATADLARVAGESCDPAALRPAFDAAYDAWLGVQHLRLGPVEENGRALAIAFWPDPKGLGTRAQRALLEAADPAVLAPEVFAEQSVAARGFPGLERMLYPAEGWPADPGCAVTRATADDLAAMAVAIDAGWRDGFADVVLTAGQTGNTTYLTATEGAQAMFTQLVTGMEFVKDQRLGRPLGTLARPRPERAEAQASGRGMRNVVVQLGALRAMAQALAPEAATTDAALARALALAEKLPLDALQRVDDPQMRFKVEIVQQAVTAARDAALAEIGPALGVGVGFNAADGD